MMIKRAEKIGVPWTGKCRLREAKLSPLGVLIGKPVASVQNPQLNYPDYYCRSFAYEKAISTEVWR